MLIGGYVFERIEGVVYSWERGVCLATICLSARVYVHN